VRIKSAIAILRVSSTRQGDNISHDTQASEVEKYCKENGLELVEVRRIVESAKRSVDRKKYRAAIEYALSNGIRHLLFYMKDRETRNLTDNEFNEDLVRSGKIVIHYVHDRKVIDAKSPGSDFFLRDIQAATAKNYIRDLSAKVADALKWKAEQGWYPGNRPPLGYVCQKPKNEDGREIRNAMAIIVPDPNETKLNLVRREFELRAQGLSLDSIRLRIKEEGWLDKLGTSTYPKSGLEARLKHKFYRGLFDWYGIEYRGKQKISKIKHETTGCHLLRIHFSTLENQTSPFKAYREAVRSANGT
jgi:DNA invertase Pin-like site-specific DNA recombinase